MPASKSDIRRINEHENRAGYCKKGIKAGSSHSLDPNHHIASKLTVLQLMLATSHRWNACLASSVGASSDYARFSLLQVGRRQSVSSVVPTYHQDEDDQDAHAIQDDNPYITKLIHVEYSRDDIAKTETPMVIEEDESKWNYNMHSMGKTVNELHDILKLHEQTLPKNNVPDLHAIRAEGGRCPRAQLRIVLSIEDKLNYLEQPIPPAPVAPKGQLVASEITVAHIAWIKGSKEIVGLMLMTMEPEIQQNLENLHAHEMLQELKTLFAQQAEQELLQTVREFHSCKQEEGQSVSSYVMKIKGYIENLEHLGYPVSLNLGVSLILISLRKEFDSFMQNYNMHGMGKTINELHAMLKLHEQTLPKNNAPALHAILAGKVQKGNNKHKKQQPQLAAKGQNHRNGKNKLAYASNPKIPPPPKKEDPVKDSICHQCVENQLGKTIKSLRSDRGGEYMSQEFLDHLKDHGIIAHRTPPYTPQQNGMSKRRNRTLLDMVRSTMSQTTLPKSFWDYALETAARILNMVPTKKVEKTPYEVWHGQAPKLSYLKVWGCEALVKRDTLTKPDKLEPMSIKCIFIGYPKETIRYSFYYPPENKVLVDRNAKFLKNSLITQETSESLEDLEIIQEEDTHLSIDTSLHHEEGDLEIDEPQSDINPIRRSTRTRGPTDRLCLYIDAEEHELGGLGEPANYKAALLDPESDKWPNAMNVEMKSMKDNEETFSPVADIRAIRILTAIAAFYDYEIWQMDVKTAFLNRYLSEEVYMEQPEGFVNLKYPNRVCKLKHFIYGLKQASRQWNKRFDDEIKKFGFTQNRDETCVYLKANGSNVTFLILYVDDILIMGNNIPMLQDVKSYLGRCFSMKDLGEATYILGIKIYRDRSQRLIEKLRLSKSQDASTHAELKGMQNVPYASTVGSIMYVVRCTRPDVAFAQNITSRFQQNPYDLYWTTIKNILKYLRNTKDMFLTGYVFILNGGAVDWKSTKQSIFATSSAKAKYIAAYDASKEAVWVSKFISGLSVVPTIEEPINMYCDNTRAITITNEFGITKGARHFCAKVHYLREVIEFGDIKLEKVHTYDNLADPFTKTLDFPKHSVNTKNIGMLSASSLM
ncbi:retrotransposon protein, putative, ty1-copia subclass [Tanacetum coccineum]